MRVGCDIGGTFTDLVAVDPTDGTLRVGKALNSGHGPAAGFVAALAATGATPEQVTEFTHGTTVVTNLLIERTGAVVGLICTRGFRDVLEIQLSFRERTFDARYRKTEALVPRHLRLEIGGRVDRDGAEVEPLDEAEVRERLAELRDAGVEALAISLYNAYANPGHERRVAELWAEVAPGSPVTCATDVDARLGEYERVSTATLNASALPRIDAYVDEMDGALEASTAYMHSAGGVLPSADAAARPILLAFSGPAAGVLAGQRVLRDLGLADGVTLDMGGTSCDVCLIKDGRVRERESFEVTWAVPARVRSLDIATVGAGGGSIAWRDAGGALRVGPRSAGALPGPACYGRGGTEATVTDANLALGIVSGAGLLGGDLPLDADAATAALATLGEAFGTDAVGAAQAIHRSVSAEMAQAVREITVRHGVDPRDGALVAFGGAGGQHAAAVATELGMTTVVVPAHSSVLSALGLLAADVRTTATRTLLCSLEDLTSAGVETAFAELEAEAASRLGDHAGSEDRVAERWVGLRYADQWHEIPMPVAGSPDTLAERFRTEHERRFGTRLDRPVEVVDGWVTTVVPRAFHEVQPAEAAAPAAGGTRELRLDEAGVVPVHAFDGIDGPVDGPCLVEEATTVTVVPAGARARRQAGHLILELNA